MGVILQRSVVVFLIVDLTEVGADGNNGAVAAAATRCKQFCRPPWQLGAGDVVPYSERLPHALCHSRHKH